MQATDLLAQVRYNLSDEDKDRWSDTRLFALLNDALADLAKATTLFVETMFYVIQNNVVDIDISAQAVKIVRVEYNDEPLPLYSFEEMDEKNTKWQLDTGDKALALVYNRQRGAQYKLYPIVQNAQNSYITYTSNYGIITGISYSDMSPIIAGTYGDLVGIPDDAILKFYYIRKHAKITALTDVLYIDDLIEQPLKHYITGMALRDNLDAQNRAMGNEELTLYNAIKEEYNIEKSKLFVRTNYEVGYNPYA